MSKAGERLIQGAKEALAIARGEADPATYRVHVPPAIDVRKIRRGLALTQEAFAARYGFSVATIRNWEQSRSSPSSAERAYLLVIEREPQAVDRALSAA